MNFWLIAAVLTALLTIWVVNPLMQRKAAPVAGWIIVAVLPALALILYALLGAPALADY